MYTGAVPPVAESENVTVPVEVTQPLAAGLGDVTRVLTGPTAAYAADTAKQLITASPSTTAATASLDRAIRSTLGVLISTPHPFVRGANRLLPTVNVFVP